MTMKALIIALLIGFATAVAAQPPIIIDPTTGKFLGTLSSNPVDPNSVSNPVGRYGSPVSPDSINNPVGRYGSPVSPYSVNNPVAPSVPRVVGPRSYGDYGW